MAYGLAMGADGLDVGGASPRLRQQRLNNIGVNARQGVGGQCSPVQFVGTGRVERQHLGAQGWRERTACMGLDAQAVTFEGDQYPVDAIH
jgi:hypothetical protein